MGGLQIQSGCGGEDKNSQPLSGLEPPIIQSVAEVYTTAILAPTHIVLFRFIIQVIFYEKYEL